MDEDARLHPGGSWPERQAEAASPAPSGLLGALPDGWVMIGRCRTGTAGPAMFPTGCYALAHSSTGIALVDVAPDATPNAEARLRRALGAADFWPAFPGVLPVWHGRIELSAWRSLADIMADGFADLPPLTVPGKAAWVAAARTALADDPAWDVPGATPRRRAPAPPLAMLDPVGEGAPEVAPRRMTRGRMALVAGFAGTFVLGLASGAMLLSPTEPVAPAQVAAAPPAAVPAPAVTVPPIVAAVAAAPSQAAAPAPVAAAAAAPVEPAAPPVMAPPAPKPEPEHVAETPPPPPELPAPPPEMRKIFAGANAAPVAVASALPLPPKLPATTVKPAAARAPDRIDRTCARAQFRFQQGIRLTAAEAAYLSTGCATRR